MIWRIVKVFVLTILVSFFVFPFSFPFLPPALNTKIMVAVFGIVAFSIDSIRKGAMRFSEYTLFSGLLAALFSLWCMFSIISNQSTDTTYSQYIVSFITWMFGAYGVYAALKIAYDKVDLELLTRYLALVAVFQCVTAMLIDNNQAFSDFIDKIFYQGEEPYYRINHRVYGLGAALDPGGIRFSVILIMIAHQLATNDRVRTDTLFLTNYLLAYTVTIIIGSVISRTTMVGAVMGIVYIVFSLFKMRKGGFVTMRMVRLYAIFFLILGVIVGVSVYMYNHNPVFKGYMRFGFEAFFNWVETGEFRTDSTDTLNNTMWVWPTDLHTWVFGRGTFGVYDNDTDIGYCNFTLYCGLVGMVIFSAYFLYCHLVLNRKFENFWIASILLVFLTFIVWIKVTTDIFFIDALLFCIEGDYLVEEMT